MVEPANTLADLRLWDGKATRFSLRAIFFFLELCLYCVSGKEEEETSLRMCLEGAALGDVKIKVLYVFFYTALSFSQLNFYLFLLV